MGQTSLLADAEDGLLAVIQTQAALPANPLAGVALQLGDPGMEAASEQIWIPDQVTTEQEFELTNSAGTLIERMETITIPVVIQLVVSDEWKTVRDRGIALAAEIEKAVRGDIHLNAKVWDARVTGLTRAGGKTDKARIMWFTVLVEAKGILS